MDKKVEERKDIWTRHQIIFPPILSLQSQSNHGHFAQSHSTNSHMFLLLHD